MQELGGRCSMPSHAITHNLHRRYVVGAWGRFWKIQCDIHNPVIRSNRKRDIFWVLGPCHLFKSETVKLPLDYAVRNGRADNHFTGSAWFVNPICKYGINNDLIGLFKNIFFSSSWMVKLCPGVRLCTLPLRGWVSFTCKEAHSIIHIIESSRY